MTTHYVVKTRVWPVGGYSLKKDDAVTIMQRNPEAKTMLVDNIYFENPIWVFVDDFIAHCEEDKTIRPS